MLAGCQYESSAHLQVAKITALPNDTTNPGLELRIGYFGEWIAYDTLCFLTHTSVGGCLTVNATQNSEQKRHCIWNMRQHDVDDLAEEFLENMDLDEITLTHANKTLNSTLIPKAVHLQGDVFHWEPPALHLVSFVIGGLLLAVPLTNQSGKQFQKFILVSGLLLSASALALAFVTSIGAVEASNALVDGNLGKESQEFEQNVLVTRSNAVYYTQAAQVSFVGAFYFFIAFLFVGTKPGPGHPA
jgi:hypothetical protein